MPFQVREQAVNVHQWFCNLLRGPRRPTSGAAGRRLRKTRLQAEELEPRCLPALITIASFNGVNGDSPTCTLIEDSSGNLFGTTSGFNGGDDGSVFEAVPAGNNVYNIRPLAKFTGGDGDAPFGGLVEDKSGNLFGVASGLALTDNGEVFEVKQGSMAITRVAGFTGTNGTAPIGDLILDSSGNLFGTTSGIDPHTGNPGTDGTIFKIAAGTITITTLASFSGSNGSTPWAGLVMDSAGNLFGTTTGGGIGYTGPGTGHGTVFEVRKGTSTITTLATFDDTTNGNSPNGRLLVDSSGNLFGTTAGGPGQNGNGTVFEIMAGSGMITTLATFNGTNGAYPLAGLVEDSHGNLFGTTSHGGGMDFGTVFEIVAGSGTITTLASFDGSNGAYPWGGLLLDSGGALFGTTSGVEPINGTASGNGTLFEIAPPAITTPSLPEWTVNYPYNQTLGTSGFSGAVTFATSSGLPPGLTLSTGGVLSGMPTSDGFYTFTVSASDSNGGTASKTYNLFINPPVMITTTSLPGGAVSTAYNQTLQASGGTTFLNFSATGTLPAGLVLNSAGVLSGTPTAGGTYNFTVTATDKVGASASQQLTLTIMGGATAKYLVTVQGSSTVQAGSAFLVTVQAADQNGNPVTSYSGPASATATLSPTGSGTNFPVTVSINSSGLGLFLANIQKAGSYTITVANSLFTGSSSPVNVTPAPAVKLAFGVQPQSTPTGVTLPAVTVQVQDFYGNVVTADNTDQVTLQVASGPGSFTAVSMTTATVTAGVATFSNLTLTVPGSYALAAIVPTRYTGPNSSSFTVLPLQVTPGSFVGSPAGFSLQFNGPILVNAVTPALYGVGHGSGAAVTPTVTLTQTSGAPPAGSTLPYQVPGSVLIDSTSNRLTFLETATASIVGNSTPALPDGTYVAHITSGGVNGLQALGSGGGYLDGTGAGTPGHEFTATFTVNAAALGEDILWVPPTADGPGQALSAPGMNQAGGGYPVYLADTTGKVTSVHATLTYDPTLLTVTQTNTGTFTVTVPTAGTAVLTYSGPTLAAGVQTPIGFLTASVPAGTAASPVPYKAKDLLQLSNVALNNNAIAVTPVAGLHLVAYVGDADGNGAYSGGDAVLITRVTLLTDTGFAAYPLVDPTIVADTDGSGFIPADAALQANEAGVGVPTANLPTPPIPSGVHFQALAFAAPFHIALAARPPTALEQTNPPAPAPRSARRSAPAPTTSLAQVDFFLTNQALLDLYFRRLGDDLGWRVW
jgi:uncharacterized repeat protein (TIGR03803 family)